MSLDLREPHPGESDRALSAMAPANNSTCTYLEHALSCRIAQDNAEEAVDVRA